jgi:hypothetical protein
VGSVSVEPAAAAFLYVYSEQARGPSAAPQTRAQPRVRRDYLCWWWSKTYRDISTVGFSIGASSAAGAAGCASLDPADGNPSSLAEEVGEERHTTGRDRRRRDIRPHPSSHRGSGPEERPNCPLNPPSPSLAGAVRGTGGFACPFPHVCAAFIGCGRAPEAQRKSRRCSRAKVMHFSQC